MQIDFIIPTYGEVGNLLTSNCIKSIREWITADYKIIVVIDGGDKSLLDNLRNKVKYSDFEIIWKEHNEGFSKTVNTGLKASDGDIKVLLNNDTILYQDISNALINSFKNESHGIVGAKLLYPDFRVQYGGMFCPKEGIFFHADQGKSDSVAYFANTKRYLMATTGAFMAISKKCYDELGGLDEDFFAGHEDVLYCLSAWDKGYKTYYNPDISLIHLEGHTRGNSDESKQEINQDWFLKEKQCTKKFYKKLKDFDLVDIERRVKRSNIINQQIAIEYYHEKRITLGIKRSGAIGDCIMVTPVIKEIGERFPGIDINVLTLCPEVFKNNPYIKYLTIKEDNFWYDVLIDLDNEYEKFPHENAVFSYSLAALGDITLNTPCIFPSDPQESLSKTTSSKKFLNVPNKKFFTFHLAKSWECRTWFLSSWAFIIKEVIKLGFDVMILGTMSDLMIDLDDEIEDHVFDLRGKTNLYDCKKLIEESEIFITSDSSLFHVSQCTKTPVICIFTCVDPLTRISREKNTYAITPPEHSCRFMLSKSKNVVNFHECTNQRVKNECIKSINKNEIIRKIDQILESKHD